MLRALLLCVLASTGTNAAVAAREGRTRGRRRAQHQLPHHTANDGALSLHAPALESDLYDMAWRRLQASSSGGGGGSSGGGGSGSDGGGSGSGGGGSGSDGGGSGSGGGGSGSGGGGGTASGGGGPTGTTSGGGGPTGTTSGGGGPTGTTSGGGGPTGTTSGGGGPTGTTSGGGGPTGTTSGGGGPTGTTTSGGGGPTGTTTSDSNTNDSSTDIPPDLSDSTTPTSPTDSTTPTSPTDSTTPTSPTDSTTPTSPTDSTTPTSPTDSTSDYTSDSTTPTSLSDDDAALPTPAVSPGPTTTTAATSPTSSYTYSDTPYYGDLPCGMSSSSGSSGPCAPVAPVFCADAPAAPLCIDVVPGTMCLAGWLPVGLGGGDYGCVWAPNLVVIVALCPAVAGQPLPPGGCVVQPGGGNCGAGFALVAAAQLLCVPATKVVATAVPLPPPNGAVPTLPPSRPALPGAQQQPTVDVAPLRLQPAPGPVTAPSGANVKPQRPANLPPPPLPPAATPLPAGTDLGVIDATTAAVWKVQLSTGFFEQTFGASYSKDDGTLLVTAASSAPPGGFDAVGRVIALDPKAAAAAPPARRLVGPVAARRTHAGPVVWARELGGGTGLYSAAYAVYVSGRSVLAAGGARGLNVATQQLGTSAYAVQLGNQSGRVRRLTAVTGAAAPLAGNGLGFAVSAPNPALRGAAAAGRALVANEITPVVGGSVDGAAFVTAYDAKGAVQWTAPGAKETTATVSLNVDGNGKEPAGVIALQTTVWPSDARSADTGADALVVQRLDAATGAVVWATKPQYNAVGTAVASSKQHRVTVVGYEGPNVLVKSYSYKTGKKRWDMKEVIAGTALGVDVSTKKGLTAVVGYTPAAAPRLDTDAFVLIMDSKKGDVLCYFEFGTPANDKATGVVSHKGALYVVGQTAGALFRAPTAADAAAPFSDIFAAQFDLQTLCPLVATHGAGGAPPARL